MESFIISVLSWIGLGINGIMSFSPSFFDKFKEFAKDCEVTMTNKTETSAIVNVRSRMNDDDMFDIHYSFDATTKRITNMEIKH